MIRTQSLFAALAAAGALLVGAGTAAGDRSDDLGGLGVSGGAGVQGFTGKHMRDTASPAGLVDVRVVVGTRAYIAFEAAYVGTVQRVDAPLLGTSATMFGTTFEGLARSNILVGAVQPYGFIGVGWTHYTIDESFRMADSGMDDSDNVLEIPIGLGVSYRRGGLFGDARATGRLVSEEDLVLPGAPNPAATQYAAMHTIGFTASVGYEF